jgi:glycine/D-amino acid oxidase-like deaminating enzyme
MKVVVIGAGIAGLAVSYFLSRIKNIELEIYEDKLAASHASTGLLYPFPGRMASKPQEADECMRASLRLIEVSENALQKPVASRSGVMRLAWLDWQKDVFKKRAIKNPDLSTYSEGQFWIPSGVSVFAKEYLDGLKLAIGIPILKKRVCSLDEIDADQIIVAAGFGTIDLTKEELRCVKGQALVCQAACIPPYNLVADGHISLVGNPKRCLVGSTYETEFNSDEPDLKSAISLLSKASAFFPSAQSFEVIDCWSGVRVSQHQTTKPLIKKIDSRVWVFSGLGSRGLLYHALYGKKLAEMVASEIR